MEVEYGSTDFDSFSDFLSRQEVVSSTDQARSLSLDLFEDALVGLREFS